MKQTFSNRSYWFITCIFCIAFPVIADAASLQTASFPIAIRVDRGWVTSSLYLKCEFKSYQMPLREYSVAQLDDRETTFLRLVTAIRINDIATCSRLALSSQTSTGKVQFVVRMYNEAFGPMLDSLFVCEQFYVGRSGLFIWGVTPQGDARPIRRSFRIDTSSENIAYWDPTNRNSLNILITDTMQKRAERPTSYGPSQSVKKQFQYAIGGTTNGSPVYLQFDGKNYDLDVFGPDILPDDEVASFYQAAYKTFANGRKEDFASLYTESSGKKFSKWVSNMRPEEFDAYYQDVIRSGHRVKFILNADPIFIVFYVSSPSDGGAFNLRYEYVVRDPASGKLRLTNFYSESFIDDLLKSKELFVTPILNDILFPATLDRRKNGK
jgi:hypothetical protein